MMTVAKWLHAELSKEARTEVNADSIEVRCTVADAEKLFETRFFSYTHDKGHTILRSIGTHSIPVDVHAAIDFVEGIEDFLRADQPRRREGHGHCRTLRTFNARH